MVIIREILNDHSVMARLLSQLVVGSLPFRLAFPETFHAMRGLGAHFAILRLRSHLPGRTLTRFLPLARVEVRLRPMTFHSRRLSCFQGLDERRGTPAISTPTLLSQTIYLAMGPSEVVSERFQLHQS